MKKAQNKMILRGITKSFTRFLSIFGIVAIGAGFLAGLLASGPDMKNSADKYFDQNNFYDFNIKATAGFTADDVNSLKKLGGVDEVMPAYVTDSILTDPANNSYNTRIFGFLNCGEGQLNNTVLLQGRMPKAAGECLAEIPNGYAKSDITVGTVLRFSPDNSNYDELDDTYAVTKFTVVGLVKSPMFISIESEPSTVGSGKIGLAIYTMQSAYSLPVYTDLYLTAESAAELGTFYSEYEDLCKELEPSLKELGKKRSVIRFNEIYSEAKDAIKDAENQYTAERDKALAELDDAAQKLTDAEKKISGGKAALANAAATVANEEKALNNAAASIAAGEKQYAEGLEQYNAAKAQLEANAQEINALKQLISSGVSLTPEQSAAVAQYDAAVNALEKSKAQLSASRAELDAGTEQIESGRIQIENAKKKIARKKFELAKGNEEFLDGKAEYDSARLEAEEEFAKAEKELNDAKINLAELKRPEWFVFDRTSNAGFNSYKTNVEKVAAIAKVFPVFFFAVAALVALTTMTRMVEEERAQTGAMKSLGFSDLKILKYYLLYSGTASLLGCVAGFAFGFRVFPQIINNAYGMMFNRIPIETPIIPSIALTLGAFTVSAILITTFFACRSELKEKPAMLLVPKAPKAGKRIWLEHIPFIWNKLSFTHKVTARNLFRYKKRLFMTVIGISGCSALLVTGFGIRDSINDIVDKQYGDIITYNHTMLLGNENDITENEALNKIFTDKALTQDYLQVSSETITIAFNGGQETATLQAAKDTEKFKSFITLRQYKNKKDIPFDKNSVIINQKLAELLHIKTGDTVALTLDGGKTSNAEISGICESYIGNSVFISQNMYQKLFGKSPETRMVLSKLNTENSESRDDISEKILSSDCVIYQTFTDDIRDSFAKSVKSIDYIVMILIICAGLLSVIVLYNLTNINICERKKELATIKVLGFFDRETQKYIFRETNIISLIGILSGLGLGVFLHRFVIFTVELESLMFGRSIYWQSFVLAVIIEFGFTMLVNLILRRKIKSIDMVEAMKAND